jgi:signal transduction histidine kinase
MVARKSVFKSSIAKALLMGVCFTLCGPIASGNVTNNRPVKDFFDLSNRPYAINHLGGEWEFYWKYFFYSDSLALLKSIPEPIICKVPAYWTSYKDENGISFPGEGYASYRKVVFLPEQYRTPLVFSLPVFDDSYRFYLNGKLLAWNGSPGISRDSSSPGYKPMFLQYTPDADSIEVVIEVSNFNHRQGGFWKTIKFGTPELMYNYSDSYKMISSISLGIIIAFALFFLSFYLLYRQSKQMLFFALALTGIFLRLGVTDSYPFLLWADIPWDNLVKIEYSGLLLSVFSMAWYFHHLYPLRPLKTVLTFNSILVGILILLVLFTKVKVFSYSVFYIYFASVSILIFYLIVSLREAFKGKMNDLFFAFTLLFLLAALGHDIRVANYGSTPQGNYVIHFAVQLFIFVQAYMMIRIWINAFKEKEELHRKIEFINQNLEQLVKDRTIELESRNKVISEKNTKINQQYKALQKEVDLKNRMFSIIAHDLRNPVSSLMLFFEYLKINPKASEKQQVIESTAELVYTLSQMIENLLYWGRSQGRQIHISIKKYNLSVLFRSVMKVFTESIRQKSVNLRLEIKEEVAIMCDEPTMLIVLRNIISNAIKFSNRGGSIVIRLDEDLNSKSEVRIVIEDNGVGIDSEKLNILMKGEEVESTFGTGQEKGTGLGLSLSKELMNLNKGNLEIYSEYGKGTRVELTVPLALS